VSSRLGWLSDEAQIRGWQLLGRHRANEGFSYVLKDEHSEMYFKTLEELEQKMRNLCQARGLEPMAEYP
jgi:hypothetical protein